MAGYRKLKLEILELRRQGKSYRQIEEILKCNRSVINFHCKKHNLTDMGKKRYAIDNKTKLSIAKFLENHTIIEAQKYFNLSKSTIFKYRNFELKQDEQK
jgi:hypothetical protein